MWSVTTAKPGNGVELLRDGRDDTYWQSDGSQPHLVNIQFQRKVFLKELAIYCDYKMDESYTPSKISIRVGTSFSDLREVGDAGRDRTGRGRAGPCGYTLYQGGSRARGGCS